MFSQSRLSHLCSAYLHHPFGDIAADNRIGMQFSKRLNGQVARTSCHIEYPLPTLMGRASSKQTFYLLDSTSSPQTIDSKRKRMVQPIISGGNVIKHRLHLFMLRTILPVWLYLFDSHSVTFFSMRAAISSQDSSFLNFSPVICS